MEAPYRVRQLVLALRSQPLNSVDEEFVRGILNEKQAALYFDLPVYEQNHAFRVCRVLWETGHAQDTGLLQAALLHDLGKRDPVSGKYVTVWGKTLIVAMKKIAGKSLLNRLAKPDPQSWRYLFWLQTRHEQRSAELAEAAGSSARVVALVAGRVPNTDPAFMALKQADDSN